MGGGGQQTDRITGTNGRFSSYTWEEVQKHTKHGDQWVVVERKVYNVSQWVKRHPGGLRILGHYAGEDATVKHPAGLLLTGMINFDRNIGLAPEITILFV